MVVVFEYDDYVNFLSDWISSRPKKGRGVKTEMAHYMGCLPAHITKVLSRDVHLTLEQAAKIITFLELTSLEGHYFLGLVELGRAGNKELRDIIIERLDELSKKIQDATRIGAKNREFTEKDNNLYYSNWLYMGIEILTSINDLQTLEAICKSLNISRSQAMEILNFLVEKKLVEKVDDKFVIKELSIKTNPLKGGANLRNHHKNWRTKALVSLDSKLENNVNFTGVQSFPKALVPVIREKLIATIKDINEMTNDHPDYPDTAYCLIVDFFNFSSPIE